MAFIRCPQCNTVIEKPASGTPVCPSCGFGASPAKAAKATKGTAKKAAAKAVPEPVAPPVPAPATWAAAPPAPAPGIMSPPSEAGVPPRTSAKATTAMVLGIVACCITFVPLAGAFLALPLGIAALVLGILGVKECNRDPAMVKGKGMAVTGIVLGSIMVVLGILLLILVTVGFAALEDAVCEDDPDSEACQSLRDRSGMAPPTKAFNAEARAPWMAPTAMGALRSQ